MDCVSDLLCAKRFQTVGPAFFQDVVSESVIGFARTSIYVGPIVRGRGGEHRLTKYIENHPFRPGMWRITTINKGPQPSGPTSRRFDFGVGLDHVFAATRQVRWRQRLPLRAPVGTRATRRSQVNFIENAGFRLGLYSWPVRDARRGGNAQVEVAAELFRELGSLLGDPDSLLTCPLFSNADKEASDLPHFGFVNVPVCPNVLQWFNEGVTGPVRARFAMVI